MALINRLIGQGMAEGEEGIPIHQAVSGLAEYQRDHLTYDAFVSMFEATAVEKVSLTAWMAKQTGKVDYAEIENILILGESGHYTIDEVKDRLGINPDGTFSKMK